MVKGQAFAAILLNHLHNPELFFGHLRSSSRGMTVVSFRATYHTRWGYVFYGMMLLSSILFSLY
jgi:hypothetical protein